MEVTSGFFGFFLPQQQIVDVCGGHGALAMLCLAHGLGQEAVIIDPSKPPSYQRLCHLDGEVGKTPLTGEKREV